MKLLFRVRYYVVEVWGPFVDDDAALACRKRVIEQSEKDRPSMPYGVSDFAITNLDHPEGSWTPPVDLKLHPCGKPGGCCDCRPGQHCCGRSDD